MIRNESIKIIKAIQESQVKEIEVLSILLNLNPKKLRYEISLLNEVFNEGGLNPIKIERGKLIYSKSEFNNWDNLIKKGSFDFYQFPDERLPILIIHIACSQHNLSAKNLQNYFLLSRSSILSDLKSLRIFIQEFELKLIHDRQLGYIFVGDEIKVRKLIEYAVSELNKEVCIKKTIDYFEVAWNKKIPVDEWYALIIEYSKRNALHFVHARLDELIYTLMFINLRKKNNSLIFSDEDKKLLKKQPIFELSKKITRELFHTEVESEVFYIETRLLNVLQGETYTVDAKYFNILTQKIIIQIQQNTGIDFDDIKSLHKTLYQHLVPAYFRIRFDLYYENSLLEKVKREYKDLYHLIKKGLKPLEEEIAKPISESEIAYFTIHFGGYLHLKENHRKKNLRALTVCPNGISSSLLMTADLRELFPDIEFISEQTIEEARLMDDSKYDLIFSTVAFPSKKKLYLTHPMANPVERTLLRERVFEDFKIVDKKNTIQIKKLVEIFEKFGIVQQRADLYAALQDYVFKDTEKKIKEGKTLPELLDESLIRINNETLNWKEAIREAAQTLLEQEYIEEKYIDAMIRTVEEIGPYIVLAPKVAVPHARPEEGVNKLGMSMLKLNNPVNFNIDGENLEDRYVQLVFVLAAVDSEAHLTALMQLSNILEEEENIEQLIKKDNVEELYKEINKLVKNEGGN